MGFLANLFSYGTAGKVAEAVTGKPRTAVVKAAQHYKTVIIGSGPAGHTAAIYLARANVAPVMFEGFLAAGVAAGGQLTTTTEVENYPGFPEGMTGSELMDKMREQSIKFGTTVITETISKVDLGTKPFRLWREGNETEEDTITADTIVVATGATAQRLNIDGEETFWNAGMSACAVCDGAAPIFKNKPLVVVGGGDSACEEATFLTKYASVVYMLVRRDKLRASKVMQERVLKHPKIKILWNQIPIKAEGDRLLQNVKIKSTLTNEVTDLQANGFFYAIGHKPNTDIFKGQLALHDTGYVQVFLNIGIPSTYTSVEGVFACGDVQDHTYRQAITAAGSGCMAALDCERYLETLEEAQND